MKLLFALLILGLSFTVQSQQTIKLLAEDNTEITGDLYDAGPNAPIILLCHQAGSSRGEYKNIAPRLVNMGYTCLAIDQRSGETMNGVENETYKFAVKRKQPTEYVYSEQDIVAGVDYLFEKYGKKVTIIGSSYSASQALMVVTQTDHIQSIIAFSPGEYFQDLGVGNFIQYITIPVFATGAKNELNEVELLVGGLNPDRLSVFRPQGTGIHGARALDPKQCEDSEEYWKAVIAFLSEHS